MSDLISRDVEYVFEDTRMVGYFCAPAGADSAAIPGLMLVHDAFGLTDDLQQTARDYAALGYAVLAADVWGDRRQPRSQDEIGPLIGALAGDRRQWSGRISAAHDTLTAQAEVVGERTAMVGYCFGGSSALEFAREGGGVRGVASIHGGLDLVDLTWTEPSAVRVLICTGADDPMATAGMLYTLQQSMSAVGAEWESDVYSGTKHAFTNPKVDLGGPSDVVGYNARSAARAWASTTRFLTEILSKE
jgi:dienelactone hydrolase